jgi:hypothetical protein
MNHLHRIIYPPCTINLPYESNTYQVSYKFSSNYGTRMLSCIRPSPRPFYNISQHDAYYFNFRTVHFVPCLGITNKCINSYQFIISLCCSYMFRQLCAILSELVCTFSVTCQFGFLVNKILRSMWLCLSVCLSVYAAEHVRTRLHRQIATHQAAT